MMLNLSKTEADVLATILGTMISGPDEGPRGHTSAIHRKLVNAGAVWGHMSWHVNEHNNIHLTNYVSYRRA